MPHISYFGYQPRPVFNPALPQELSFALSTPWFLPQICSRLAAPSVEILPFSLGYIAFESSPSWFLWSRLLLVTLHKSNLCWVTLEEHQDLDSKIFRAMQLYIELLTSWLKEHYGQLIYTVPESLQSSIFGLSSKALPPDWHHKVNVPYLVGYKHAHHDLSLFLSLTEFCTWATRSMLILAYLVKCFRYSPHVTFHSRIVQSLVYH
jgi:hypothetical protein